MLSAVKAISFFLAGTFFYTPDSGLYDFPSFFEGEDRGWYQLSTDFGMREGGEVLKDHRIKLGGGFTFTTPSSRCDEPFGWGPFCGDIIFPFFAHFSLDFKLVRRWDGVFRLSLFPVSLPDYLISAGGGVKAEIFSALSGNLIVSIEPLLEYNGGKKRYYEEGAYVSYANGIGFALPLWITYVTGKESYYFFIKARTGYTDSRVLETGWMDAGMGGGFEYGRNHRFGIELYYFHKRFWGIKKFELEFADFWNFFGISVFFNFRVLKVRDDTER